MSRSSRSSCGCSSSAISASSVAAVPVHRVGVALGLAVLPLGERRLRHQRAQPGVVGLVGEVRELLVGDRELATELHEPFGHIGQPLFEQRAGHPGSLGPGREVRFRDQHRRPAGARFTTHLRRCWNRHTGQAQTLLSYGACGFESHPPHHDLPADPRRLAR